MIKPVNGRLEEHLKLRSNDTQLMCASYMMGPAMVAAQVM
jgi:hypothetical protein